MNKIYNNNLAFGARLRYDKINGIEEVELRKKAIEEDFATKKRRNSFENEQKKKTMIALTNFLQRPEILTKISSIQMDDEENDIEDTFCVSPLITNDNTSYEGSEDYVNISYLTNSNFCSSYTQNIKEPIDEQKLCAWIDDVSRSVDEFNKYIDKF